MDRVIISGFIRFAETKDVGSKLLTTLKVPVNKRSKNAQGDWENDDSKTIWYELSAWDDTAVSWQSRFAQGDYVTAIGEPELNVYKDGQGNPKGSIRVRFAQVEKAFLKKEETDEAPF